MKNIALKTVCLILAAFSLAACQKDNAAINDNFGINSDEAAYDSTTSTLKFAGARSTISMDVVTENATGKWDARCPTDDIWCSFSKSANKLIVTVAENHTDKERESHITIILGDNKKTVKVIQDYTRNLSFASSSLNVGAASGDYSIGLITNIEDKNLTFKVEDVQSDGTQWLSVEGLADGALNFHITKNHSETAERSAVIVASGDGLEARFAVTQNVAAGKPYIVPLADLNYDFDKCYSYLIMDTVNNIQIGNVCREYLFKVSSESDITVQTAAVVIYPVKNGTVDHSNGFVLATIDNETGNVTPSGGSVMWNSDISETTAGKDMIASFTPGTMESLPSEVYFKIGANRFGIESLDADDADYAITAALKPWVVTDTREGAEIEGRGNSEEFTYRVVKVGCQYWFADNLKTTRFRDGSPIPTGNWNAASTIYGPQCASAGYTKDGTSFSNSNANLMTDAAIAVRNETGPVYNYFALVNDSLPDMTNAYLGSTADKLAPEGWGVPTINEFKILNNYITQLSSSPDTDPKLELVLKTAYESTASNITGFSAECYRYRSATGTNSSHGTHYATIDGYNFTGTPGAGTATSHMTTAFCCGKDTDNSFRSAEVRWGIYVRCVKR